MDWDEIFWIWFSVALLVVISVFFLGISMWLLFFIQILLLMGFLIEKMSFKETKERVGKTQKRIYDFWLRTREMKPEITIRRKLLDKFK